MSDTLHDVALLMMEQAKSALEEAKSVDPQIVLWQWQEGGRGMVIPPPQSKLSNMLFLKLLEELEPDACMLVSAVAGVGTGIKRGEKNVDLAKLYEAVGSPCEHPDRRLAMMVFVQSKAESFVMFQMYTQEPEDEGPVVWGGFEEITNPADIVIRAPFGPYFEGKGH